MNMERKQEHDFDNKWIEERTNGFWKYYVKHLGGVVMIMFGIFVASCIAKKEINAIYLLVSMVVAGIFPFLAWAINEIRIKANESRNGNEKRKQEMVYWLDNLSGLVLDRKKIYHIACYTIGI